MQIRRYQWNSFSWGWTPSAGDKHQDPVAPESTVTEAKTASLGVAEYIHIVYTFYQRCSS